MKLKAQAARWGAGLLLALVLGWAFLGYLHPDMLLNWETVLQMCGFRP